MLNIHEDIKEKLGYFNSIHKIPNIIFHGSSGCGKRTIVNDFIHQIYNYDKDKIRSHVMYVNCAHGKGIKFIREELKFFAKTHINSNNGDTFKSVILLNADKLTMDAQSALRRCIELFSHNTRFFIIVEDKYKLLKPILSRFCEIHVPEPMYEGKTINLYQYNLSKTFDLKDLKNTRINWLKKDISKNMAKKGLNVIDLMNYVTKLYEKGYSGIDLMHMIENTSVGCGILENFTNVKKYELLIAFNKIKKEFRSEKMLMFFVLNFVFLNSSFSLENISFM